MTELNQQLKESIQELEQIRKIKEHTAELKTRLSSEERDLMAMEQTLAKEQKDVETLEREGLTTMFRKFLGDREEKLDKERAEYLKASLRYNEIYKSVELIRFELDLLTKKEQSQESVERRVAVLLKQREEELMRLDPAVAQALQGINQQTDKLHAYGVEVEQAFTAGTEALEFVRSAEQNLHEALLMGQRDMWGGRHNYFTGQLKHQAIDRAKDMAFQSRHALIKFGNELRDVFKDLQWQANMEIEEFGRFADIFFDNLITDYLIQQKISKSLVNITGTRQRLEAIMLQLDEERGTIINKVDSLEQERKKTILEAES
jgi:hypothetical protein